MQSEVHNWRRATLAIYFPNGKEGVKHALQAAEARRFFASMAKQSWYEEFLERFIFFENIAAIQADGDGFGGAEILRLRFVLLKAGGTPTARLAAAFTGGCHRAQSSSVDVAWPVLTACMYARAPLEVVGEMAVRFGVPGVVRNLSGFYHQHESDSFEEFQFAVFVSTLQSTFPNPESIFLKI